jgi:hypothetical protein
MKNAAPRPGHESPGIPPCPNPTTPPWLRHHRQRWLRHDAHLWIRPDAARFFPPGTDPAVINPTLPRKADAAKAAAFEAELAAEVAKGYRLVAVLREEVAELRAERKRRRELEAKYSPSQPRVPAGNPRGGQWTDRSGGQGTVAGPSQDAGQSQDADLTQPMGNVELGDVSGSSELDDLFRIKPSDTRTDAGNSSDSIVKIAADDSERRYSVNLQEEEARGGHTLRDHVGKTDAYLIGLMNADYERSTLGNLEITRFRDAEGSFATPEQANDYVNQLLKLERDKVDQVATGAEKRLTLESRIGSVTGYEAFRPNGDSDPYIRDTYGVRAIIINDSRSPRGYTVRTAFPVNQRPGR